MSKKIDLSRREFLLKSSLLSASSIAAPFALNLFSMNSASAAALTGDYKALVCVYLAGGNDHNNTVIATDSASLTGYHTARGSSIALADSALTSTALTAGTVNAGFNPGRSFSLHPSLGTTNANMVSSLKGMFDAKQVAIIPNVGSLIAPIANWSVYRTNTALRPANLFSHSDQTNQWVNTYPGTVKKNFGWGGRMADQLIGSNPGAPNFSSLSLSGTTTFLAGEHVNQYQINSNGVPVAITNFNNLFGSSGNFTQTVVSPNAYSTNAFEIEHALVVDRAIKAQSNLQTVMTATAPTGSTPVPAPLRYTNPNNNQLANNSLATQLQTVARVIAGQATLGAHRQIFYVSIGGFDTHSTQIANQADLMARLSHAIDYFYNIALKSAGMPGGDMTNNVTLFTASDFGRTLTSNGDGTDHGWGAHHFVVGGTGAVKGGDIYGSFPQTFVSTTKTLGDSTNNPLDVGSGNYIPQISVDQYAATMAKWFGLTTGEIDTVFPNLPLQWNATRDLGFMV